MARPNVSGKPPIRAARRSRSNLCPVASERKSIARVEFDSLIHEKMRLGILSALAVNDALSFNDLKKLLETTDGNLSVHARRLEDAAYIHCTKSFAGRVPKTEYRLTATGRKALDKYLDQMEWLIQTTRER